MVKELDAALQSAWGYTADAFTLSATAGCVTFMKAEYSEVVICEGLSISRPPKQARRAS